VIAVRMCYFQSSDSFRRPAAKIVTDHQLKFVNRNQQNQNRKENENFGDSVSVQFGFLFNFQG
jgi:hypothetical protein